VPSTSAFCRCRVVIVETCTAAWPAGRTGVGLRRDRGCHGRTAKPVLFSTSDPRRVFPLFTMRGVPARFSRRCPHYGFALTGALLLRWCSLRCSRRAGEDAGSGRTAPRGELLSAWYARVLPSSCIVGGPCSGRGGALALALLGETDGVNHAQAGEGTSGCGTCP